MPSTSQVPRSEPLRANAVVELDPPEHVYENLDPEMVPLVLREEPRVEEPAPVGQESETKGRKRRGIS